MDKEAVIHEVHYMEPNQTIELNHPNVVINSVVTNVPVLVNYKEGKITSMHPNYYTLDQNGKFEIVISYLYHLN